MLLPVRVSDPSPSLTKPTAPPPSRSAVTSVNDISPVTSKPTLPPSRMPPAVALDVRVWKIDKACSSEKEPLAPTDRANAPPLFTMILSPVQVELSPL